MAHCLGLVKHFVEVAVVYQTLRLLLPRRTCAMPSTLLAAHEATATALLTRVRRIVQIVGTRDAIVARINC